MSVEKPTEIAYNSVMGMREGERHYGEYCKLAKLSDARLFRAIKSYERNIAEHRDKVANPIAHSPDWSMLNDYAKQGRVRYWEKEIEAFEAKLAMAHEILRERGL